MLKDRKIIKFLPVFMIAAILVTSFYCQAQEREENIWEDEPSQRNNPEFTNRILDRIAETEPERAEQLRELQKDDPEKFRAELMSYMQKNMPRQRPGRGESRRLEGRGQAPDGPMEGPRPELRGGPGGPGSRPGGGRWREHLQKRYEEYLKWLKEDYPEVAQKLEKLREENPEAYIKEVAASLKIYDPIKRAQENNPKLAEVLKEDLELKQIRDELLRKLQNPGISKNAKDKAIEELQSIISRRFDLIILKKQLKYEDLREKLERLQRLVESREKELEKLKESKDKAIKERLNELTKPTEKIDWQ